jgi:ribosomal protein S18 acetylase RimI-like enzyme
MVHVRALAPADEDDAAALFDAQLGGRRQARLGELVDVLALPGFGAWDGDDDRLVGLATYDIEGDRAELAAIVVGEGRRWRGIGSQLIGAVVDAVIAARARELWLVTTNDNVDALRLYQRRGFRLAELHAGAVDRARELKPAIPTTGTYGIPIRDELVLIRSL